MPHHACVHVPALYSVAYRIGYTVGLTSELGGGSSCLVSVSPDMSCLFYCVCCRSDAIPIEESEKVVAKQPPDVVMATAKEVKDDEVQTDSAGGILARFRGGRGSDVLRAEFQCTYSTP